MSWLFKLGGMTPWRYLRSPQLYDIAHFRYCGIKGNLHQVVMEFGNYARYLEESLGYTDATLESLSKVWRIESTKTILKMVAARPDLTIKEPFLYNLSCMLLNQTFILSIYHLLSIIHQKNKKRRRRKKIHNIRFIANNLKKESKKKSFLRILRSWSSQWGRK